MLNKKVIVLCHIPKSAGNSVLDAITTHTPIQQENGWASTNGYYMFYDAFGLCAGQEINGVSPEVKTAAKIINKFYVSKIDIPRTLILRLHSDFYNLDNLIPKHLSRKYLISLRNPTDRMSSAWRHTCEKGIREARSDPFKLTTDDRYNWRLNRFFDSDGFKLTLNKVVPNIFGLEQHTKISDSQFKKCFFYTLSDYMQHNEYITNIEKYIGLTIPTIRSRKSITNSNIKLPEKTQENKEFYRIVKEAISADNRYYNDIMSRLGRYHDLIDPLTSKPLYKI